MRELTERLPPFLRDRLQGVDLSGAREVRVRAGWPVEVRGARGRLLGAPVEQAEVSQLAMALTGYSIYACEAQLREGFFTLPGGFRVGLTGRYAAGADGPIQTVTSIAIRISRHVPGEADRVLRHMLDGERVRSALILSAPCMGKTTLLRALIGRLTQCGYCVAVADERDELGGAELGARADVCALSPKATAIMRMVRSLAPDVVATDEVGRPEDAEAISEAARCGAAVIATAHAATLAGARARPALKGVMDAGVFERYVLLSGAPGHVAQIFDGEGCAVWTDGRSD